MASSKANSDNGKDAVRDRGILQDCGHRRRTIAFQNTKSTAQGAIDVSFMVTNHVVAIKNTQHCLTFISLRHIGYCLYQIIIGFIKAQVCVVV